MRRSPIAGTSFAVAIDGIPIDGLLHATFVASNCFSADTFTLGFAMGPAPLADINFWSVIAGGCVEVAASADFGATSFDLITGNIDAIAIDPIHGTVVLEGRDLSASMVDSYRQQSFVNQTASEVVSAIAGSHGLSPIVTSTLGSVGRYYGDGFTRLSLGDYSRLRSDWDLLVELARENGFDVFVEGRSLYFQPSSLLRDSPLRLTPFDLQGMRIERNLMVPRDASARVQSWNSQNMASYASDEEGGDLSPAAIPDASGSQPFLFSASNLTPQQTSALAARYGAELTRLSTVLHLDMPWDLTLSPRMFILLDGVGGSIDGMYRIESVDRHYNSMSGSRQSIRAALSEGI